MIAKKKDQNFSGRRSYSADDVGDFLKSLPLSLVILDRNLRIRRFTPLAATIFNLTRHDIGKPIREIRPAFYFPELERSIRSVIAGQSVPEKEIEGPGAGWYSLRVHPYFVEEGELIGGAMLIMVDITGIKCYELQILALNKELTQYATDLEETGSRLQSSNTELEQFAYAASHDLQEPLRQITNYIDLLKDEHSDLSAAADKYMQNILEGAIQMRHLIFDLLAYARTLKNPEIKPTDLDMVMGQVLTNLSGAISRSGSKVSSNMLPTVLADPIPMVQLFQNLVGNAIKYRRREEAASIHVTATEKESEWLFEVSDNGIGIESRYFERIFEIYQRLSKDKSVPGTGLGLTICKKIVERHQGKIWVDSTPGIGSRFYFTLPKDGESP